MSHHYPPRNHYKVTAMGLPSFTRGLHRLGLRLQFDPRIRETVLVAVAALVACYWASSSLDATAVPNPDHTTAAVESSASVSPERVYWLTR
ncbi:MAG: hypothetical protein MPN21_01160 [Thermoanaerobaculia bacterium]|nr:hypothetical protein [Thermoanaerobaculia bacterium]